MNSRNMKRKTFTFVMASFLCVPQLFAAPGKGGTYIDPANVDADYVIQGEYTGTVDGEKTGGQLIALGDGKFEGSVTLVAFRVTVGMAIRRSGLRAKVRQRTVRRS
jgi:hypothetical protein